MKNQVAILIVVGILMGLVNGQFPVSYCVNQVTGNDDNCTSGCAEWSSCKTISRATLLANNGDTVIVQFNNGSANTYNEYVIVESKLVNFLGGGITIIGGFQFNGVITGTDDTGALNITNFSIHFNKTHSALNFVGTTFNVVNLNNLVLWNDGDATEPLALVDFTKATRPSNAVTTSYWDITCDSFSPEFSPFVTLFAGSNDGDRSNGFDFDITFTAKSVVPMTGYLSGWNVKLTLNANTGVDLTNDTSTISIANNSLTTVFTKTTWPALNLLFDQTNNLYLSVGETNHISISNSRDVVVDSGNRVFNFTLYNVNLATISKVDNSIFYIGADYTALSTLNNVLFRQMTNTSIKVIETYLEVPTDNTFNVTVRNNYFQGTHEVIYNPFGFVWVDAKNNFFGTKGPNVTCNPNGTLGAMVSTNVWITNWCLDPSCTEYEQGPCSQEGTTTGATTAVTTGTSTTGSTTGSTTSPTTSTSTTTDRTTGPTTAATSHHSTTGEPVDDHGIGGGGIAGIIIGVLAVIILIGVGVWYFKFKGKANYQSVD